MPESDSQIFGIVSPLDGGRDRGQEPLVGVRQGRRRGRVLHGRRGRRDSREGGEAGPGGDGPHADVAGAAGQI